MTRQTDAAIALSVAVSRMLPDVLNAIICPYCKRHAIESPMDDRCGWCDQLRADVEADEREDSDAD